MSKQDDINKILFYSKGKEYERPYGRNFWVEGGVLTLQKETETPGNPESVNVIIKTDDIPVDEYKTDIQNAVFKPTVRFMSELKIEVTEKFRQECSGNQSKRGSNNETNFVMGIIKGCKQDFASREEDVEL